MASCHENESRCLGQLLGPVRRRVLVPGQRAGRQDDQPPRHQLRAHRAGAPGLSAASTSTKTGEPGRCSRSPHFEERQYSEDPVPCRVWTAQVMRATRDGAGVASWWSAFIRNCRWRSGGSGLPTAAIDRADLSWFRRVRVNVDSFPVPLLRAAGGVRGRRSRTARWSSSTTTRATSTRARRSSWPSRRLRRLRHDGRGVRRRRRPRRRFRRRWRAGRCLNSLGLQPYAGLIAAAQFKAHLEPGQSTTVDRSSTARAPNDKRARSVHRTRSRREVLAQARHSARRAAARSGSDTRPRQTRSTRPIRQMDRYYNVWSKYQAPQPVALHRRAWTRSAIATSCSTCWASATSSRRSSRRALLAHRCGTSSRRPGVSPVRDCSPAPATTCGCTMDLPLWIPDTLVALRQGDRRLRPSSTSRSRSWTRRRSQPSDDRHGHASTSTPAGPCDSLSGQTGYHGLCRIGYGDWNDAISRHRRREGRERLAVVCVRVRRQDHGRAGRRIGQGRRRAGVPRDRGRP